jgi:preprotein translocase subunit SecY
MANLGAGICVLLIVQLVIAGSVVILLDELLQEGLLVWWQYLALHRD